jgi:hypothetical protein
LAQGMNFLSISWGYRLRFVIIRQFGTLFDPVKEFCQNMLAVWHANNCIICSMIKNTQVQALREGSGQEPCYHKRRSNFGQVFSYQLLLNTISS